MAVRWQLRQLFQEPQIRGVITVERPPSPPPPARVLPPPVLPPPLSGGAAPPPGRRGLLPEECAMFQCRGCRTVLGDSLHLCAQEQQCLGLLVCFKVTNDVSCEDSLMFGLEGALLGCAYHALSCRSCGLIVGFILYSSSSKLAYLRGLFSFFKDSILCYLLKNQKTIEASKVNFPAVSLKEEMCQLKKRLLQVNVHIEVLMKKVEELEQKRNKAERQSSAPAAAGLQPGYATVRVT
ncbi:protein Mis18-beta [Colius striatus]|uniref:protein Mis18-beta n=1 Tax=Colius striatus TaxID=57412 RepID=UPI002B1D31C4|nr:protein Mis18-beta [Colius striatus]